VINARCSAGRALLDGFTLHGFGSALLGALIVSITSWIASWYVGRRDASRS
jgi:uncharacterized membrane protein YvlD (DUF360 family)